VAAGIVGNQIVVDAKSGISGAGRGTGGGYAYSDVNEDVSAYKIANHNHQPEISQELGGLREGPRPKVTFVPHLVPMTRGIHATCYAQLSRAVTPAEVMAIYRDFYRDAPFTRVVESPPHTKHTLGNNMCLVHPVVDVRNGMLVAAGVLDNLVKGAAGQAIENMNLMLGLPQTAGLDLRRSTRDQGDAIDPGGTVTSPGGYQAGAVFARIKTYGDGKLDLAVGVGLALHRGGDLHA
jgi:N-acetyl-gamma-glutamyl-phosphate reductase